MPDFRIRNKLDASPLVGLVDRAREQKQIATENEFQRERIDISRQHADAATANAESNAQRTRIGNEMDQLSLESLRDERARKEWGKAMVRVGAAIKRNSDALPDIILGTFQKFKGAGIYEDIAIQMMKDLESGNLDSIAEEAASSLETLAQTDSFAKTDEEIRAEEIEAQLKENELALSDQKVDAGERSAAEDERERELEAKAEQAQIVSARTAREENLRLVNELIENERGMKAATGVQSGRIIPGARRDRANFESQFANLQARLAFGNIDQLKGAMSDNDILFLEKFSSPLDLEASNELMARNLQIIKDRLEREINSDVVIDEPTEQNTGEAGFQSSPATNPDTNAPYPDGTTGVTTDGTDRPTVVRNGQWELR